METRGTRCRFSRKAPQKLSCRVVARLSYSWNYICLSGLQPSKEVFCQAFFQKSGNRVPRVFISPTNHNLTHYVSTYFVIASELATATIPKSKTIAKSTPTSSATLISQMGRTGSSPFASFPQGKPWF